MTYYMYFIQTFIIRCTVSEILAEIDHKGPNWTISWKWPLEWFHTFNILGQDWFHNKEATWCNKFGQHLSYYWIISIIMGKWANPDLSDLENDLLNNSIKSISWQLINIIPKKLHAINKEKLSDHFWENWQKVAKQQNLTFFEPFGPWKITFRVIQSNPSFGSSLVPSLGSFLHK